MKTTITLLSLFFVQSAYAQSFLEFSEACSPDENIEITAVGDILLHSPLAIQATQNSNRFVSLWSGVLPAFDRADLSYANLEGPVAPGVTASGKVTKDPGFVFDNQVYTSYPMFNYHPHLVGDLVRSGFDVVSTANNHSLDRHSIGVDLTIQELQNARLPFTGTKSTQEPSAPWYTVTQAKGKNIAWLACTFSTNGIPDKRKQVLDCYRQSREIFSLIRELSHDREIDVVIATPHWGDEYKHQPNESEIRLGRQMIEAGATAVLATHPHVVQPWEKFKAKDGREGFIIYSTGNFVSGQAPIPRRVSLMVQLHLTGARDEKLKIRGVQFLPLFMQKTNRGYEVVPVFQYNGNVPPEAASIWRNFYHESQRLTSFTENSVKKICDVSKLN